MKKEIQKLVDEIQRNAFVLNSLGYDVSKTFDEMRNINRGLVDDKSHTA